MAVLFLFSILTSFAAAETIKEQPFRPFHPEYMAQGGSFTAVARGYNSLFTNPAGFGESEKELTISSLSLWSHSGLRQTPELVGLLFSSGGESSADQEYLKNRFSRSGYGFGGSWGLGYVSGGLGLGFLAGFDSFAAGDDYPNDLTGYLLNEYMIVVGYSFVFDFPGIKVLLGADVRPLVRIHSMLDHEASALMVHKYFGADIGQDPGDPFQSIYALNGSGVALDAGLILHSGPFTLGIVLRDIFDTQLRYSWDLLSEIQNSMLQGGLPPAKTPPGGAEYIIPMNTSIGAAFHPDMGNFSRVLKPMLHIEIFNPVGAFEGWDSFIDRFRLGGEVKISEYISLRGGLLRGYPTYGAGLSIFIFDLNFAVFNAGFAPGPGGRNVPGITVEAAIRW